MKTILSLCLSMALTGVAVGDEPKPAQSDAVLEREIHGLKQAVEELNERIRLLELRIAELELRQPKRFPWRHEQPFYWDGRQPFGRPRPWERGNAPEDLRRR